MIDLHTHVLPRLDDGSDGVETTVRMLKISEESGVTTIAATPHFDRSCGYDNYASEALEESFRLIEREAAAVGVKLVRGMEIMAGGDVPELLKNGRLWTIGGTGYFLTEFAFEEDPAYCREYLKSCREAGFKPVIAHPERYKFIQRDPQTAYEWCRSGYAIQINRGSIMGRFGEQARITAARLIGHGLAACVASDAHGAHRRTPHMADVRRSLMDQIGSEYTELLLERNPARILADRELLGYEPYPFI